MSHTKWIIALHSLYGWMDRWIFILFPVHAVDRQGISPGDRVITQASRGRKKPIDVRSHISNKVTQSSSFQITESMQRKKLRKEMSGQAASSLSTLPIELAYRILDHVQSYNILVSAYSICTRWNSIIDTYRPYQVILYISRTGQCTYVVGP